MDVWKESPKIVESINFSQYFDKDIDVHSEQGFFFTERNNKKEKNKS